MPSEVAFRALVPAVVEGAYLGPILLKLASQQVMVSRLTSEAVAVLSEHHGDPAHGHQVPHAVHPRPLKARATLPGVRDLLENLVALSLRIASQGFELLSEGVTGAGACSSVETRA
jgi:hypothetical protein